MDALSIALILGGLIGVSTVAGLVLRAREGRLTHVKNLARVDSAEIGTGVHFGPTATLLQFSTEFCTKCPGTRAYLSSVAAQYPGVDHVEVDITNRQDLANKYKIMQTPTTFILDDTGAVAARIGGAPRPEAVTAALSIALKKDHDSYVI